MGTAERRCAVLKILCRRRHETISNLASEFGVSVRTIQRDVDLLSRTEPIYTQAGKYGGGVYVVDGYSAERIYMTEAETALLRKVYAAAETHRTLLTDGEKRLLFRLISQYSRPKPGK